MLKMNQSHPGGNTNRCLINNHVYKITVGLGDYEESQTDYLNVGGMELLVIRAFAREMYVK